MTSKEALEKISWRYVNEPTFQEWCNIIKIDLERLEKYKQALAILKVIDVDIRMILITDSVYSYNEDLRVDLRLSKEEYELLKEVLGYD